MFLAFFICLIAWSGCSDLKDRPVAPLPGEALTFAHDIQPLLQQHCAGCHSGASAGGQYDLSSLSGVFGTGSNAVSNVVAGNAQSMLLTALGSGTHAGIGAAVKAALHKWVVEDSLGIRSSLVHPEGWMNPASDHFHGTSLAQSGYDLAGCQSCHGADYGGGIAQSACTTCHVPSPESCSTCHGTGVNPAPPMDLSGNFGAQHRGVGAHQVHLTGGVLFNGMPCEQCHPVPAALRASGHLDGSVDVRFSGLAAQNPNAAWNGQTCNNTQCHGASSPQWTSTGTATCGSCHGNPPPAPHPQIQNCSLCHGEVVDASGRIVNKTLHVNGQVEVKTGHPTGFVNPASENFHGLAIRAAGWSMAECRDCHGQSYAGGPGSDVSCLPCHSKTPEDCSVCHGSANNPAPPRDLDKHTATALRSVGAHQAHLTGGYFGGPVACSECHIVPVRYDDPGHLDPETKVVFGSLAKTGGKTPVWDGLTCSNTHCHGASAPRWTAVGVGEAICGDCHGIPPPAPHPPVLACHLCHERVVDAGYNIINKALHMNGRMELGP